MIDLDYGNTSGYWYVACSVDSDTIPIYFMEYETPPCVPVGYSIKGPYGEHKAAFDVAKFYREHQELRPL